MLRKRERGSIVEIIPILMIGVLVLLGAFQMALFMSGKHAAELAAFRASRVLEQKAKNRDHAARAASHEARRMCAVGYPLSLSSTAMDASPSAYRASVTLQMEPLVPLPDRKRVRVRASYPPRLDEGGRP